MDTSEETYFDSDYASVAWIEDAELVVLKWKRTASHEAYRTPLRKAVELAAEKKAKNWLADTTFLGIVLDEDAKWLVAEIGPAIVRLAFKKRALIVPNSVLARAQLNVQRSSLDQEYGIETRYFADTELALRWIREN